MFHGAEHEEPEEYADQTIADNGSAGSWAKVLENGFVKCDADLVPAVRNAGSAKVHPCSHSGTGTKNKPKATDGIHVGKQVDQSDQTHKTTNSGAAETEDPFLVAGADGRQRYDEAGDNRRIDTGIVESDEGHVANEGCQRALDGKADIIRIVESIRQKQASFFSGCGSGMTELLGVARHRQGDLVQCPFDVQQRKGRQGVLFIGERYPVVRQAKLVESAPHPLATVRHIQKSFMKTRIVWEI